MLVFHVHDIQYCHLTGFRHLGLVKVVFDCLLVLGDASEVVVGGC